jgi:voltage-gated potassium channel
LYLKIVSLEKLERFKFFKYSHRRPWLRVAEEVIQFAIFGLMFSIIFAIVEKSMLGSESFIENFGNSVYYLMTSLTTIGYGDISPQTLLGKLLFAAYICGYGVYKMVDIVGLIVEAKEFKKKLKRKGRLFMSYSNQITTFFNAKCLSANNFLFLDRFINENLKSNRFGNSKILLVNSSDEYNDKLSDFLEENHYFNERVTLINADIYEKGIFEKLSITQSKQIYIFADQSKGMASDSRVLDSVVRIRAAGYASNNISVEIIDDNFRPILEANNVKTIIRPTRSYPSLIVRGSIADGSERVIEELLSGRGDSFATFRIAPNDALWADVLSVLSRNDVGTPLAVIFNNGHVDPNPKGSSTLKDVAKIIIMINEFEKQDYDELNGRINKLIDSV